MLYNHCSETTVLLPVKAVKEGSRRALFWVLLCGPQAEGSDESISPWVTRIHGSSFGCMKDGDSWSLWLARAEELGAGSSHQAPGQEGPLKPEAKILTTGLRWRFPSLKTGDWCRGVCLASHLPHSGFCTHLCWLQHTCEKEGWAWSQ